MISHDAFQDARNQQLELGESGQQCVLKVKVSLNGSETEVVISYHNAGEICNAPGGCARHQIIIFTYLHWPASLTERETTLSNSQWTFLPNTFL